MAEALGRPTASTESPRGAALMQPIAAKISGRLRAQLESGFERAEQGLLRFKVDERFEDDQHDEEQRDRLPGHTDRNPAQTFILRAMQSAGQAVQPGRGLP